MFHKILTCVHLAVIPFKKADLILDVSRNFTTVAESMTFKFLFGQI